MAARASGISSSIPPSVPTHSNPSETESVLPTQVALATLQLKAPSQGSFSQDDLIRIIQTQATTIENQAKQVQEQNFKIKRLQAKLSDRQKKPEQNTTSVKVKVVPASKLSSTAKDDQEAREKQERRSLRDAAAGMPWGGRF